MRESFYIRYKFDQKISGIYHEYKEAYERKAQQHGRRRTTSMSLKRTPPRRSDFDRIQHACMCARKVSFKTSSHHDAF